MNSSLHVNSDMYCPFCLKRLTKVIKTGHTFCPDLNTCEYEALEGAKKPLTKDEREHIVTCRNSEASQKELKSALSIALDVLGKEETLRIVDRVVGV